MDANSTIDSIVGITDTLIPVTLLTVWLALRKGDPRSPALPAFGVVLAATLVWGALWTWWPPLSALRFQPPPAGQAMAILAVVLGMSSMLLLPSVRAYLSSAHLSWLAAMGVWRFVYGSALLAIGLMQGLPPAFFWSAALGDIAVGIWGITIMARRNQVSTREFALWNVAGLADLGHVLVLGAINLRPFYLANPDVQPLNLLPLAGVPVFVALHILTLWGLRVRQKSSAQATSIVTLIGNRT